MKMVELFLKYGIASLFGVTRYLHSEVERLQMRVWQLENRLYESHQPQGEVEISGYEDLDSGSNLDESWFSSVKEIEAEERKLEDAVYGIDVKPRNIRRTVDDLMREAKARHSAQYQERAMREAAEQERTVEEMLAQDDEELHDPPVTVKLSEAKQKFLIEAGKSIMQTSE